jgi:signal transduction histidine kinase
VDEETHITRVEGIIRDITDRKIVEENLKNTERSRQSLLTNISHELRTPITSIVGYIAAIKEGRFEENTKKNYIDLIYKKSLHLQRLVQDLFQLTQFESKQISFNFSQITISEFIKDVLEKYEWDIFQNNINFEINYEISEVFLKSFVIIDIERIDQVCSNIVFNAIKYTSTGGKILINLTEYEEDYLLVSISDTGPGILPKDTENIFDRFFRSKIHQNYEGSGLGLAISKEIIEFHKGNIWVDSKIGEGSTFHFTIPFYTP